MVPTHEQEASVKEKSWGDRALGKKFSCPAGNWVRHGSKGEPRGERKRNFKAKAIRPWPLALSRSRKGKGGAWGVGRGPLAGGIQVGLEVSQRQPGHPYMLASGPTVTG